MRFHRELLLVALSFLFLGSLEAQELGLQQVFGNGQAVKDGTSFALGVRALGPGNVPQAGVRVFAASVIAFGPTLSCAEGTTGGDGRVLTGHIVNRIDRGHGEHISGEEDVLVEDVLYALGRNQHHDRENEIHQ